MDKHLMNYTDNQLFMKKPMTKEELQEILSQT
jgi:hypothetical protein